MNQNLAYIVSLLIGITVIVAAEREPGPKASAKGQLERPVPLSGAMVFETEQGFTKLFNGKDLAGWEGNPKLWSVEDGAITGQTTPENPARENTFLIWTNGTVDDFELRLSYKLVANNDQGFANSGVQYRSKVLDPKNWVVGGYQGDMEAGPTYSGILYEERMTRGIMAERGEKVVWNKDCQKQVAGPLGRSDEIQAAIRQNDWNEYVIIAQEDRLRHFINGRPTVDVTDECDAKRALSGVLALQLHQGPPMTAQFKNIRIRSLSSAARSSAEEIKELQGVWEVTGGEVNGAPIAPEDIPGIVVTIEGDAYKVATQTGTDRGGYTVNPSQTPKQMDILPENGPDAGKTLLAIYELGPDNLRVCYAMQGGKRPRAFAAEPDSGRLVITYKRRNQ